MLNNYVAPGVPSAKFLLPTGKSLSISVIESNRDLVSGITSSIDGFKHTDIHWLAREVDYHMLWNWRDEENGKGEKEDLEAKMDTILEGSESVGFLQNIQLLINFMRQLLTKYGEKFYEKMLSFDAGEKEDDCGNNKMFQSDRLGECVLLGIRLGIDSTIIDRWKGKLREENSEYISENTFPEDRKY